jgi:hypothetical protein
MAKITTMTCPVCLCPTKTNGVGAMSGGFAGGVSWVVDKIYPIACRLFEKPARYHDWRYSQLGYGKERADREFLRDMLRAVRKRDNNFFTERWLKYQANKFYLAVKIGGGDAYEAAQKECRDNLENRR